jgi:hypothetical protein
MEWDANNQTFGFRGVIGRHAFADERSINGDPAFASDGHAIQSQSDSWIAGTIEKSLIVQTSLGIPFESHQVVDGAFEDKSAIGLSNFQINGDLPSPGREGAITDLQVFDVNEVPLFSFQPLSERITQGLDFVHVPVLVPTSNLNQSENQQDHSTLQHNLSFGTQTLPLDRNAVNRSVENGQWLMGDGGLSNSNHSPLTAAQLDLLSRATITIDDLAEGYLALTTGTTITLDRDAAGLRVVHRPDAVAQ